MPNLNVTQLTTAGQALQPSGCQTAGDLASLWSDRGPAICCGLYFHVPFCFHKCHYCDFYSLVDREDRRGPYVSRLLAETAAAVDAGFMSAPLGSIFAGGGTPTLLGPDLWRRLLERLAALVPRAGGCEFTVEANPETVTPELLDVLVAGGVNRLSIGAQSFQATHLATLERRHDPASVERSVRLARAAGMDNLNLDLIFAIPDQTLTDWRGDLDRALALEPDHLSCYALTYEPNTPMTARMRAGRIVPADEDLEADMFDLAIDRLRDEGFEHYEISNWARPGRRCRHNMTYWTNESWWALGPSAAGHVRGVRWKNVARLAEYLRTEGFSPVSGVERLDAEGAAGEALMLGLRLIDGIEIPRLEALLAAGGSTRGRERAAAIEEHVRGGLLERRDGRLRLTRRGLPVADSVLAELV